MCHGLAPVVPLEKRDAAKVAPDGNLREASGEMAPAWEKADAGVAAASSTGCGHGTSFILRSFLGDWRTRLGIVKAC